MRYECFADVVRSGDGDDSSDDMSPEERAYYLNLEPDNALLMGQVENVDDGTDHRFHGSEGVGHESSSPGESDTEVRDEEGEIIDDRSNQQLWQRLKNDVEQDLSLDKASPAQLQIFFKQWINARGAEPSESSRYRFFIIMDKEMVRNLLEVGMPLSGSCDDHQRLPVKVFDAEFKHTRLYNPELFHPKLVARLSKDEGWFWTAGSMLANLFFQERAEDWDAVRSWDAQDHPIHRAVKLGF